MTKSPRKNGERPACAALIACGSLAPAARLNKIIFKTLQTPTVFIILIIFKRTGPISTRFRALAARRLFSFPPRGRPGRGRGAANPAAKQDFARPRPVCRSGMRLRNDRRNTSAPHIVPDGPGISAPCNPPPPFILAAVAKISTNKSAPAL